MACPHTPAHPRSCPRQAQGLVSLRATGREVFDWILDQGLLLGARHEQRGAAGLGGGYLHSSRSCTGTSGEAGSQVEGSVGNWPGAAWAALQGHGPPSEGFHGVFICLLACHSRLEQLENPGLLQQTEELKDRHQRLSPG